MASSKSSSIVRSGISLFIIFRFRRFLLSSLLSISFQTDIIAPPTFYLFIIFNQCIYPLSPLSLSDLTLSCIFRSSFVPLPRNFRRLSRSFRSSRPSSTLAMNERKVVKLCELACEVSKRNFEEFSRSFLSFSPLNFQSQLLIRSRCRAFYRLW